MPLCSGDLFQDIHRLTERTVSEIEQAIQDCEEERVYTQTQIDEVGAEISQRESDLAELDTLFGLNAAAGKELEKGVFHHQKQRLELKKHEDKMCPFGGVLIRECSYVVDRQGLLQITQVQDAHSMKQLEAKRTEESQKIELAKSALLESIRRLDGQRRDLQAKRGSLETEFWEKRKS